MARVSMDTRLPLLPGARAGAARTARCHWLCAFCFSALLGGTAGTDWHIPSEAVSATSALCGQGVLPPSWGTCKWKAASMGLEAYRPQGFFPVCMTCPAHAGPTRTQVCLESVPKARHLRDTFPVKPSSGHACEMAGKGEPLEMEPHIHSTWGHSRQAAGREGPSVAGPAVQMLEDCRAWAMSCLPREACDNILKP